MKTKTKTIAPKGTAKASKTKPAQAPVDPSEKRTILSLEFLGEELIGQIHHIADKLGMTTADYVERALQNGVEESTRPLHIDPRLYRRAQAAAFIADKTVDEWISAAIMEGGEQLINDDLPPPPGSHVIRLIATK